MAQTLVELARAIADSGAHDIAVHLLRNVPGLPPIVQTLHLLSIAIVLGSIVMLNLRVLGLATPTQQPAEMSHRFAPWICSALPMLLASGIIFVLARPQRYLTNPVFGLKFTLLLPALGFTALLFGMLRRQSVNTRSRVVAGLSLLCWLGVVLAGRWIAYSDYLFPIE
jgi:putative copper export protein